MKNTILLKKLIASVATITLCIGMLVGCGEVTLPTAEALTVDENGTTSLGIGVGSSYEDFIREYGGMRVQILNDDGSLDPIELPELKEGEEVVASDMTLMVAGFFINGESVATEDIAEVDLQSKDYLKENNVIYRYITFKIIDNKISEIGGDFLDYNTELY